jgi:PAS domain S-box-containing protein
MPTPLHVLILEDNPDDAELILHELCRAEFEPDWVRAETEADYLAHLDPTPDVILADFSMPQFNALRALALLQERALDIPLIVVSGTIGEDVAVECMRVGAADYLLKDRLARLGQAVTRALEAKRLREEKRQAEAALYESEEKYRTLVERSNDGITIIQDGTVLFANRRLAEMWGGAPEEVIGTPFTDYVHPDEIPKVADRYRRRMAGKDVSPVYETALRHRNGNALRAELNAGLITYQGKPANLVMVRDITERVQVEKRLRWLGRIAEQVGEGVAVTSLEGNINFANQAWAEMHGYKAEELIGKHLSIFHNEEQLQGEVKPFNEQAMLKGQHSGEVGHVRRDGTPFPTSMTSTLLRDETGETVGLIGFATDITERKQTEAVLRQSAQLLQSVIDTTPDWIFAKDRDFRYILANKSFASAIGTTPEQMVGKNDLELGFPEELVFGDPERGIVGYRTDDVAVFEQGEPLHNPYDPATTASGEDIIFDTHKLPLRDDKGDIWAVLGFARDITERKRMEEALEQRAKELARSNQELQQFAYVASHDLQEPLRMVTSYLQLLQRRYEGQLDDDADEFIGYAVNGANRMKKLINDLLSYSRVETRGKEPKPADSGAVLDWVLANLAATIGESGATIVHGAMPTVRVDDTQLGQLFQNLIDNAIKFRGDDPPTIHIEAERQSDQWCFAFRDNGIGIDPQYFDRIFIIFQRLHSGDRYPGTGIGLAICKKIVERHGGRIWVESETGKGSTFYFTLPENGEHQ